MISNDTLTVNNAKINLTTVLSTLTASMIDVKTISISSLSASRASIDTLNVSSISVSITNVSTLNVSLANIFIANASMMNTQTANVSTINVSVANVSTLNVSTANVSTLNVSLANMLVAKVTTLNVSLTNASVINVSMANVNTLNVSTINATNYYSVSLNTAEVIPSGSHTVLGSLSLPAGTWLVKLAMNVTEETSSKTARISYLAQNTWYGISKNIGGMDTDGGGFFTIMSSSDIFIDWTSSNIRVFEGTRVLSSVTPLTLYALFFFTDINGSNLKVYPDYSIFNAVKLG